MKLEDCHHLLVFGGSFDPPHRAHVELPERVRQRIGAELIAYVPAARAPHKLDRQQTAACHRLAMLKLALADQPNAAILTDEIERGEDGEPSYTVDTLEHLRSRLPADATVRLLIGADQVRIFDQWKDADRVAALAEPVVMVRPPDTAASLLASLPENQRPIWRARLVELPQMAISSTEIRDRITADQPIEDIVPAAVAQYIREHGLYRNDD